MSPFERLSDESDQDTDWTPIIGGEESKGGRKKTSSVWRFCEPINDQYALCNVCHHKLSYKSSVTNLRKHFKKKHPGIMVESNMQYTKNNSNDSDREERNETQRATNSVIVDYLRPAGEENRSKYNRNSSFSKYAAAVKRERSPERLDCRLKYSRHEESEFELFGRSIVMQLKQLPLVHALEVQAEITNLILQKRIQALRQNHQTNTEDTPMQYALVYATTDPTQSEELTAVTVEKVVSEDNLSEAVVNSL